MKRTTPLAVALVAGVLLSSCGLFRGGGDDSTTPVLGERLPVLSFEQSIEADPELADLTVVLPPATPVAEGWTQPGGSAAKAMGHLPLAASIAPAWSVSIGQGSSSGRRLNSAPVAAGGRVYTIDTDATVRAFDARNGGVVWSARVARAGENARAAFGGGVSLGDGRVYATSGYGHVAAFDAATGAAVWSVDVGSPLRGAPGVDGGRVYVVSTDNQLFALNVADGKAAWDVAGTVEQAGLLGAASPAIAQDTIVVGYSSGELNAMRVENGRVVWQDALARTGRATALAALADIVGSPVIDRGRVFAIGHGGRMAALELSTGQRVWERSLTGVSTPWSAGDFVYVLTLDGQLLCLTRAEGRVKWMTQLPRWRDEEDKQGAIRWSGPVLAGDRLLLTGSEGQLMSVSPYDGKVAGTVALGQDAYLPPIVADGTLYVLTDDGTLRAYR